MFLHLNYISYIIIYHLESFGAAQLSHVAPFFCRLVFHLIFLGFDNYIWYLNWLAVVVDGDHDDVGAVDYAADAV